MPPLPVPTDTRADRQPPKRPRIRGKIVVDRPGKASYTTPPDAAAKHRRAASRVYLNEPEANSSRNWGVLLSPTVEGSSHEGAWFFDKLD